MNSENENDSSLESKEDLHELLEAAERRKSNEIQHSAKSFWLIIGIAFSIFMFSISIFLLTDEPRPIKASANITPTTPSPEKLIDIYQQNADYDSFVDPKDRVEKTSVLGLKEPSGDEATKQNIQFAKELFNFLQPAGAANKK